MEKKELRTAIKQSFDKLYKEDFDLIREMPRDVNPEYSNFKSETDNVQKQKYHVSERGIVFRYGLYLNDCLNLKDLKIDIEYNRDLYNKKVLKDFGKTGLIYPDLIIHKRINEDENLLVMEFKTWWNRFHIMRDIEKIQKIMKTYDYKYGIFAYIGKEKPSWLWVEKDKDYKKYSKTSEFNSDFESL